MKLPELSELKFKTFGKPKKSKKISPCVAIYKRKKAERDALVKIEGKKTVKNFERRLRQKLKNRKGQ